MKTTLCIIDMQPSFVGYNRALKGVLEEIWLAKRRRSGVVVLEYSGGGDTCIEIHKALLGYSDMVAFAIKTQNGGGTEFLQAAKDIGLWTKRVRVCGVYGCKCVFATALELVQDGIQVQMANSATKCACGNSHRAMFEQYGIDVI